MGMSSLNTILYILLFSVYKTAIQSSENVTVFQMYVQDYNHTIATSSQCPSRWSHSTFLYCPGKEFWNWVKMFKHGWWRIPVTAALVKLELWDPEAETSLGTTQWVLGKQRPHRRRPSSEPNKNSRNFSMNWKLLYFYTDRNAYKFFSEIR